MLKRTYDKVNALFDEAGGYLPARELLANKITIGVCETPEPA